MRKFLLTICLLIASFSSRSQISDFTIDSCYFANTIGVVYYNFANDSVIAGCGNEFGFEVGDNEILTMGTRLINMGQHDCSFQGLGQFDPCHGHIHLPDMANLYISNACGEVILTGDKLGFNMQDGSNFMQWLLSGSNTCDDVWLNRYGLPDYALSVHQPNDNFNGSDRMGLSAGYYDTYGPGTWGNGIRINNLPNGSYYASFGGHFSQYMNQGLNIFPDSIAVPFELTGSGSNRYPIVGAPIVVTQPSPVQTAKTSNGSNTSSALITWEDSGSPCKYEITPVYKTGNTWNAYPGLAVTTTGRSYVYSYQRLHDFNISILHKNGVISYQFDVRAVNGNMKSTPVRTTGTVNIK